MLSVVTLKWGDKFPAMYYNILERMLPRWLHIDYQFICVTDDPDGLSPDIETIPLQGGDMYPAQWTYMNMFRPQPYGIKGRILLLDVGIVVVGDLMPMIRMKADFICGLDWFYSNGKYDCNVILMEEASMAATRVWEKFKNDPEAIMNKYGNLEFYFSEEIPGQETWPGGWVVSYKKSAGTVEKRVGGVPPGAKIICFHGNPLPHQVIKNKKGMYGPDPWIEQYWREDL